MRVIYGLENLPPSGRKRVVTIGFFDGVHKGHQAVIKEAVKEAGKQKTESAVLTFEPHPLEVLKPGSHPPILTSTSLKAKLIEALGIDLFLVVEFTKELAALSPKQFIDHILLGDLRATTIVVGEDFKFGREKEGDVSFLKRYSKEKNLRIIAVPSLRIQGKAVSSTLLRELLARGDLRAVAEIQGRYPRITAKVVRGRGEGTSLGFSTANLEITEKSSLPANGVYAGYIRFNGKEWACAIYIGTSPTFDLGETRLEIHIFNFEGDLYDRQVDVEFKAKIRNEKKFPNRQALAAQIKKDIAEAKSILT